MSGRVVLVTGGADGIGWAVCRRFAQAGDRVVLADLDGARALARAADLGEGAFGLACDVALPGAADAAVGSCLARFGGLDVLVNNAGIIDSVGTPAVDTPLEGFRRILDVNLGGACAMAERARAAMSGRGGVIVNLASAGGFVATPLRNAYGASKAAVVALTRVLGAAWAADGVRVVAVAPGYVRTPLVEPLITAGKLDPQRVGSRVPLGRMGRPEEIAAVIFHVASAEAGCRAGTTVVADGGFLAAGGGGGPFAPAATPPPRIGPRTAIVTGADSPAGSAIAAAFAANGDRVALLGRDEAALEAAAGRLGGSTPYVAGAPTDEAAMARAVEAATAAWGGVDVLVAAAAPSDGLISAFVAAKGAGPALLRAGGGAVVTLAWADGSPGGEAAAAGIVMLARSLACEWASHGVRVNTITASPDTDSSRIIAGAALFLASDAASYVTGAEVTTGETIRM